MEKYSSYMGIEYMHINRLMGTCVVLTPRKLIRWRILIVLVGCYICMWKMVRHTISLCVSLLPETDKVLVY